MKLLDYLKGLPGNDAREAFAKRCGTSLGYLQLVAYGHKKASEGLVVRIAAESANAVTPADVLPAVDWSHLDRLAAARAAE
jgi:DNA-binding transcriptional regulator YdaS (Cro superfamily)